VYAYHTDAGGLYARDGSVMPRLRGWMVTDAAGRYELSSIRPAPYPSRSIPAHVHFNAWGAGYPRQWFAQMEFEGDRLVTDERMEQSRRLGRFGMVRRLRRRDGVWRCTFDLRLGQRSNY
jgi:protocatechuate 3,4-dioxygenase beta subunit